jgi:hypothetical protein
MRKKILIIGNDEGLPGVKMDIRSYQAFFKSAVGGNWYDSEIETQLNPVKRDLLSKLSEFKRISLDYLIVYFSGHGGQERETMLELNRNGELIAASDLIDIASRQLTIYDCCRCYPEVKQARQLLDEAFAEFSGYNTREKFEKRIMESYPQQIQLYACSVGEYSNDTPNGGVYSQFLLQSASNIDSEYKLVGTAHMEATELTVQNNRNLPAKQQQHPDSLIPKVLSSRQLIIGINPRM